MNATENRFYRTKDNRVKRLEHLLALALDCLERSNPPKKCWTYLVCKRIKRALTK